MWRRCKHSVFCCDQCEYYGIEGSSTQVKRLQKQYMEPSCADECLEKEDKKQINVSVGDFTKALPFAGEFDLILDRSSVTHNNTADIRKAIALAYEKLRKGGYYFGLDWFSTNFGIFSDSEEVYDVIDDHTRVFHSGYFEGLGNVHFSNADHIQELFQQMTMIELYEKVSIYTIPKSKRIAHWSFVAQK